MTALDLLVRDVPIGRPTQNIWSALATMRERAMRHILVVNDTEQLVGIVSNRDYRHLLQRIGPDGTIRGLNDVVLADIMTPSPRLITASPDAGVVQLARLFVDHQIGVVPVVEAERHPLGLVSYRQVLAALIGS